MRPYSSFTVGISAHKHTHTHRRERWKKTPHSLKGFMCIAQSGVDCTRCLSNISFLTLSLPSAQKLMQIFLYICDGYHVRAAVESVWAPTSRFNTNEWSFSISFFVCTVHTIQRLVKLSSFVCVARYILCYFFCFSLHFLHFCFCTSAECNTSLCSLLYFSAHYDVTFVNK